MEFSHKNIPKFHSSRGFFPSTTNTGTCAFLMTFSDTLPRRKHSASFFLSEPTKLYRCHCPRTILPTVSRN